MIDKNVDAVSNYSRTLNTTFSVLVMSLGFGCLGTDNPKFFAVVSLIFVILLVPYTSKVELEKIEELRTQGDPSVKRWRMFKNAQPFILGWIFLGLIAFGWVNKSGWVGW